MLDLHRPAQEYTPKQDTILSVLSSNLQEGGYFMPNLPKGASMDEHTKLGEASVGKPWAIIQYHAALDSMDTMYMNMIRCLLSAMIMIGLFCWIVQRWSQKTFGSIFLGSLFVGLITFIQDPYTVHIWYQTFDIRAYLADSLIIWGLNGVWLGWWLRR